MSGTSRGAPGQIGAASLSHQKWRHKVGDKSSMSTKEQDIIARWRLSILGPLVSARLDHGDRSNHFNQAAKLEYDHPDGQVVRPTARTIEGWYYQYLKGGWQALRPEPRSDAGKSRAIRPEIAERLVAAKRQKPRRTIRQLIRAFERGKWVHKGELTRSSVHRLLQRHALAARPPREHGHERRSFLPEHACDLWVGDVMHGPMVQEPGETPRKSYLISILDAATRFIVCSVFATSESAVAHENVFLAAIERHGLPRAYYVDRGAAYIAESLATICVDLGIQLIHTKARDPEAKGSIERWHRTLRDGLIDELDGPPRRLQELNRALWAWLAVEYHSNVHSTTKRAPGLDFESQLEFLRPVPGDISLRDVFLHREHRPVRKDGCVRLHGGYYEVPGDLVGEVVELRFDPRRPEDHPLVFVDGHYRDVATPLDRHRNADGRRRALPEPDAPVPDTIDFRPLALIEEEYYRTIYGAEDSDEANDASDPNDAQEGP